VHLLEEPAHANLKTRQNTRKDQFIIGAKGLGRVVGAENVRDPWARVKDGDDRDAGSSAD
jgi:hypothetical protein